eukprot:tig00000383_g24716.t1
MATWKHRGAPADDEDGGVGAEPLGRRRLPLDRPSDSAAMGEEEQPLDAADLSLISVALTCPGGFFWIAFGVQAAALNFDLSPSDVDMVPGMLLAALVFTLSALSYGDLIRANPEPRCASRGPAFHVHSALSASRFGAARKGAWLAGTVAGGASVLGLLLRGVLLVMACGALVRHLVASQALIPAHWWLDFVTCTLALALAAAAASRREVAVAATLATGAALMQVVMVFGIACVLLFFRWRNWLDFSESAWLVEEWFVALVPSSPSGPLVQAVFAAALLAGRRAARRSMLASLARSAWGLLPLLYAAAALALNFRLHCLRADLPSVPPTPPPPPQPQPPPSGVGGGGGAGPAVGGPEQTCGTGFPGVLGELLLQVSAVVFGDGAYLAYTTVAVVVLLSLLAALLATLAALPRLLAALAASGSLPAALAPPPGRPAPALPAALALLLLLAALGAAPSFAASLPLLLLASSAATSLAAAPLALAALLAPAPSPPRRPGAVGAGAGALAGGDGGGPWEAALPASAAPSPSSPPSSSSTPSAARPAPPAPCRPPPPDAPAALASERRLASGRARRRWKAADGKGAWAAAPAAEGEASGGEEEAAGVPLGPARWGLRPARGGAPRRPAPAPAAARAAAPAWGRPVAALLGRLRRGGRGARAGRAGVSLADAEHDAREALDPGFDVDV